MISMTQEKPTQDGILTVKQVAARLHVSNDTVVRLITEGKLRAKRIGKRMYRIREEWLQEFLDKEE